jgi:hypothetical protein
MDDEITIPDEVPGFPGEAPGLSFGDLLRWAPVVQQVVTTAEAAIAGGSTQIPAIKIRVAGKRITLGPVPISIEAG